MSARELIVDSFAGAGGASTGIGFELKPTYFAQACRNLAERETVAEAAKLKRMGVLAGVSDLCGILPANPQTGASGKFWALELKRKGGRPRREQQEFMQLVEAVVSDHLVDGILDDDRAMAPAGKRRGRA